MSAVTTNEKLTLSVEIGMPPEARSAVEEAFLRIMRARYPERSWELLTEEAVAA